MPEPTRWTNDLDAAATAPPGDGRARRARAGDTLTGTVHAPPWWQRSAARHPVTRLLVIFVPLAGLWFGWKYHDVGTTPAAPATPQVEAPPVAAPDMAVSLPTAPVWPDTPDAHMSDEARRTALLAKEAAWRAWYQRPAQCEHPATPEIEVECATHYLEHARAFEARYRAEPLPTAGAE